MSVRTMTLELEGQSYTIPYDDSIKKYKKQVPAPNKTSWNQTDHKYEMRLRVEDMAGNITIVDKNHTSFGSKMMLRVLEKTPPMITITKPAVGAYLGSNAVTIEFTVTDSESGVDQNTITLQIDSQAAATDEITKTPIANGYKCTYQATIKDGGHTIKVDAKDNDDNAAVQKTTTFTVDTVPPELNVSSPSGTLITNKQKLTVRGTTSEQCTIKIKLNNADQGNIPLGAEKTFEKEITLTKGSNIIVVTATDLAGKVTTIQREVTYDPVAPVVVTIDLNPNPVNEGEMFTITVEATDE